MPKLKVLSGLEIVKILKQFDFWVVSQKGSHIKLKRIKNGENQTLTIPNHKEIDRGTLKSILNQITNYISLDDIYSSFYI